MGLEFVALYAPAPTTSLRWIETPAYNLVFVSGKNVGELGQLTSARCADPTLD